MEKYQVAVIGGGPGGYVAAVRCAQLGFKTVCVDKRKALGGTCLNVGCIPSKSLLHVSELYNNFQKKGTELGFSKLDISFDFSAIMEQKKKVIEGLVNSVETLIQKNQITHLEGSATFLSPNSLIIKKPETSEIEIEADYIILATGSEPIPLPFALFDEEKIVSSTGALSLSTLPSKFIVIGGGVIGVEIASIYQRLGSEVTVIEMLSQICPGVDLQSSKTLLQILTKQGISFQLNSKVTSILTQANNVVTVEYSKEDKTISQEANVVLICVGRRPHTESLNLSAGGVTLDDKGRVIVDTCFRTSQKNIFAIGDLIEGPGLAHRASEEGIAVANFLAGKTSQINYLTIPNVIYTYPEVASVGFTDEEAKEKGLEILQGISYFRGNPRGRCTHSTEGYVKIICEKHSERIVGMHIIGPQASELITIGAVAIEGRMSVRQLAELPFPHPTFSECIKEAALQALSLASSPSTQTAN